MRIDAFFFEIGRNSQEAGFKVRDLQRVDSPQVQADAGLLLDGFDVAVMGFVAPSLIQEWGLSRAAFGPVMSAGMVGLAIGALTQTERPAPPRQRIAIALRGACRVTQGILKLR